MSKMVLYPVKIITAGDMSAASITSSVTDMLQADFCGLQFVYTGSPVGTLAVQVSLDGTNYVALPVSVAGAAPATSLAIPGSTSPIYVDISLSTFRYIRAVYTKTSGTGTLDAWISTKRIGD